MKSEAADNRDSTGLSKRSVLALLGPRWQTAGHRKQNRNLPFATPCAHTSNVATFWDSGKPNDVCYESDSSLSQYSFMYFFLSKYFFLHF